MKKKCCSVCILLFDMSEGEGRASEVLWNSIAVGHTGVEMG